MAIPTRLIKRRIKSVRSTKKIMKAMELVSASKMRKATQLALHARPYAQTIQELTEQIRQFVPGSQYPFLVGSAEGTSQPTLLVVVASDRGLCGGFNAQLLRIAMEFVRGRGTESVQVMTVGRRAEQAVRRANYPLVAAFESIASAPSFDRARPMSRAIVEAFMEQRVGRVFVAYTDFKSALSQIPVVKQLLPIVPEQELSAEVLTEEDDQDSHLQEKLEMFEPSASEVLERLLPRVIEIEIYQAFLESAASEHSARMMAMRSAGDAAGDMMEDLTFTLNQARQSAITREISEISAGKAAVE